MKIGVYYNWLIFCYLVLITVLTLNGNIAFGHGLGDWLYIIVTTVTTLLYLTGLIKLQSRRFHINRVRLYLYGTFFLMTALLLTWKFTVGRGPEYAWNGNIFLDSPFKNKSLP